MSDTEDFQPVIVVIETSPDVGDLFAALAKAQGEITGASKDAANPHFRSKYATLMAVWDACRAPLSKAGVAVIQAPYNDEGDVGISTTLGVASGQWMRSKIKVQPTKYDAQSVGSVMTYLRRYALAAMVGVAPEDDDGEAAVGRPTASRSQGRQDDRGRDDDRSRGSERETRDRPSSERRESRNDDRGRDAPPPPDDDRREDSRDAGRDSGRDSKRESREDKERGRRDDAQKHFLRLKKEVHDALDHATLDDLEKDNAEQIALIKDVSTTSYERLKGWLVQRHDDISHGVTDPGAQP